MFAFVALKLERANATEHMLSFDTEKFARNVTKSMEKV